MTEEKRSKVIGVRITQRQYEEIRQVIKDKYITPSCLGRILIEMFLRREVRI